MERESNKRLEYTTALYAHEDVAQQTMRAELDDNRRAMQLAPVEARILQVLLIAIKAKKVLEIGTLVGYSAIAMAHALPADGRLISIEHSPDNYLLAQSNITKAGANERITLLLGDALTLLPSLQAETPFDAVFIDADKAGYPEYLEFAYKYLRTGGMVIADNTFLFDEVLSDSPPAKGKDRWLAMRRFNQALANRNRFEGVILPTPAGLSVAIKV